MSRKYIRFLIIIITLVLMGTNVFSNSKAVSQTDNLTTAINMKRKCKKGKKTSFVDITNI